MTEVTVIVPARDAARTLGRTLDALAHQEGDLSYEVIVVDDGSSDETVEIASSGGARVIRQQGLGPGEARNAGAREARAPVLVFTDADCFPDPGWLRAGLAATKVADLVQGQVLPDTTATRRHFDHTIWVTGESGLYETANLFVRRDLYLRVGGFEDWLDVGIGKRLGEDVWFGWKARRAGARTLYAADALVRHAVFPRRWHEYVLERRRLVYFPDLVRKMPELRSHFLHAGVFVTPRSAAFAAAAAGIGIAAGLAAADTRSFAPLLPLAAAFPYATYFSRRAFGNGRYGPKLALADCLADAVGFASLGWGSVRRRTLVL